MGHYFPHEKKRLNHKLKWHTVGISMLKLEGSKTQYDAVGNYRCTIHCKWPCKCHRECCCATRQPASSLSLSVYIPSSLVFCATLYIGLFTTRQYHRHFGRVNNLTPQTHIWPRTPGLGGNRSHGHDSYCEWPQRVRKVESNTTRLLLTRSSYITLKWPQNVRRGGGRTGATRLNPPLTAAPERAHGQLDCVSE